MPEERSRMTRNESEFWLNLQKFYELRLAEKKVGKGIRT